MKLQNIKAREKVYLPRLGWLTLADIGKSWHTSENWKDGKRITQRQWREIRGVKVELTEKEEKTIGNLFSSISIT